MFNYQKHEIVSMAKENGFRNETLEKVLRLIDVLEFINGNEKLSSCLALKGGTAINLTLFNLPRLSVDIDLDFSKSCTKDEMIGKRNEISAILRRYMDTNGYFLSDASKMRHALDSFAFTYTNAFGNRDHLKIEINYMNRVHVYGEESRSLTIPFINHFKAFTLNIYELYGSKIKALLERCTIRDVYDVFQMIKTGLFDEEGLAKVKKCVVLYMAIGSTTERDYESILTDFYPKIDAYMLNKIPQYLSSTLRKDDDFSLLDGVKEVKEFISDFMILTKEEKTFLDEFQNGNYCPEILFDETLGEKIRNHPMAIWKVSRNRGE